jgi:hypothetical protein
MLLIGNATERANFAVPYPTRFSVSSFIQSKLLELDLKDADRVCKGGP